MRALAAGLSDVGLQREHNEDSFVVADLNTMNATLQPEVRTHAPGALGSLFMVADGMGGAAAGEIASAMATEVVLQELDSRWRSAASGSAGAPRCVNPLRPSCPLGHPRFRHGSFP